MNKFQTWSWGRGHRQLLLIGVVTLLQMAWPSQPVLAQSLCAEVKIEIRQELTLERQGFDAMLRISNGYDQFALENLTVMVNFTDATGGVVNATSDPNDTNALFYIRVSSMENVTAIIDGAVAPAQTAEIHWLIIPAQGAGGTNSLGVPYDIGATLNYSLRDVFETTDVFPDRITVRPMPKLTLDYFLPYWVYGDDPWTETIIEPVVPFSLGLRVQNTGAGPANSLKVESAQPEITDNKLGLLVSFALLGCEVQGQPWENTLLADFGTVAGSSAKNARWTMAASLSGKFTNFTARFTHSDILGGKLTSLIDSVNTHVLIGDVQVDLPGRDAVLDFLAEGAPSLKAYESDRLDPMPVANVSGSTTLTPLWEGGETSTYRLSVPATADAFYAKRSFPAGTNKTIQQVVRLADGKVLPTANAWINKTRVNGLHEWEYWFHLFDVGVGSDYEITFAREQIPDDAPPVWGEIPDQTVSEGDDIGFIVVASDPNGTMPSLSVINLPANATFIDNLDGTGYFLWQTHIGDYGVYAVRFVASDGETEVEELVQITVKGLASVTGLEISPTHVNVRENGEGRFFVRLDKATGSNIAVSVSRSAGNTNLAIQSGGNLMFTPANWNAWQAVTLAEPADDDNTTQETATFRVATEYRAVDVQATSLDDDIGENLALASGGATNAASAPNTQPMQSIDGMHTSSANYGFTLWTNVPPGSMTLDLRGTMIVARVRILNWDWDYRIHRYMIESSQDGTSWSILVDASASDRQGWDNWAIANAAVRYLRFTGLSNSVNPDVRIAEWEVYGTRGPASSSVDSDRDGVDDNSEYIAGTDLCNPESLPMLTTFGVASTEADSSVFQWPSATGRIYSIWMSTNAACACYYTQHVGGIAATAPTNTYTNVTPAVRAAYYGLRVFWPDAP